MMIHAVPGKKIRITVTYYLADKHPAGLLTNNACSREHPEQYAIKHHSHILPIISIRIEIVLILDMLSNKFYGIRGSFDRRIHFTFFFVSFGKPGLIVTA